MAITPEQAVALGLIMGGGSGGTTNYNSLNNKPQINGVTLQGNKTTQELGILSNNSEVYDDYEDMVAAINAWESDKHGIGDNIFIRTANVPDLWISGVEETSVPYEYTSDQEIIEELLDEGFIQIGYYLISALETQKVDIPDVQIDGTSIVDDGVANIPVADGTDLGVIKDIQVDDASVLSNGIATIPTANTNISGTIKESRVTTLADNKLDAAGVRFDKAQSLSSAQKQQARDNIGVQPETTFTCELADGSTKTLVINGGLVQEIN